MFTNSSASKFLITILNFKYKVLFKTHNTAICCVSQETELMSGYLLVAKIKKKVYIIIWLECFVFEL